MRKSNPRFSGLEESSNRLDNVSSGGYYIQISKEGLFYDYAVYENQDTGELIKNKELSNRYEFNGKKY